MAELRNQPIRLNVRRVMEGPSNSKPGPFLRNVPSRNVVVGEGLNFSSFGGLVVGDLNEISGEFASVSGGRFNTASGSHSLCERGLHQHC